MDHLLSVTDLSDADLQMILDRAAAYDKDPAGAGKDHADRIVCMAFFEPSTRTRLSFEAAAHRLGAAVIGFSDGGGTSVAKGETLEDTVRVLSGYADILVIRHPEEGAAGRAAAVASVPVVNAGDGTGEHPTQALLDLFTLETELGGLQGKQVALVGDLLHGRTVHSLVPLLRRRGAEVAQVAAPGLALDSGDVPEADLEEMAASADVLYVTRIQRERFQDEAAYQAAAGALRIDRALLERTESKALVMHPLPRVDELATDVDALPAAKYFDQAHHGVAVRMAVLASIFEGRA